MSDLPAAGGPFTIQQASRLLDVPAPTIRSWERRYGVPESDRSSGGHRRYTPAQLSVLRQMRDQIARGHGAGEAAAWAKAWQTRAAEPWVGAFLDATSRLDAADVGRVLDSCRARLGLGRTVDQVLFRAMREVGRWWETGRCDVAHEHLATAAARAWLSQSTQPRVSRGQRSSPVLLACGPRDHHTLGLESLGALLCDRGLDCRLLGARTPTESLTTAISQLGPAGVVVVSHLPTARRSAVETLRAARPLSADLFYAGNAFVSRQSRRAVPGTYLGGSVSQAADLIAARLFEAP